MRGLRPEVQRRVQAADFVVATRPVQRLQRPSPPRPVPLASPKLLQSRYGLAFEQLAQIAIPPLHDQGLTGAGVRVALLDNGFHYAEHAAFASIRVVAQRDFVNDDEIVADEADQPSRATKGAAAKTCTEHKCFPCWQAISPITLSAWCPTPSTFWPRPN